MRGALSVKRIVESSEWKCGSIIGDVVLEELSVDSIDEGLPLRTDMLDASIVNAGAVCLSWGNRFGKAQCADGRLCVGNVGEVVITSGQLEEASQRMRTLIEMRK